MNRRQDTPVGQLSASIASTLPRFLLFVTDTLHVVAAIVQFEPVGGTASLRGRCGCMRDGIDVVVDFLADERLPNSAVEILPFTRHCNSMKMDFWRRIVEGNFQT